MALGILEPKDEHVAGTVYVYDQARGHIEQLTSERNLKRDRSGKIILVPQPSDDPNDPLVGKARHNTRSCVDKTCRTGQCESAIPSSPSSQSLL